MLSFCTIKFTNSQNNINHMFSLCYHYIFFKKNSQASIYKFFFKALENSLKILDCGGNEEIKPLMVID